MKSIHLKLEKDLRRNGIFGPENGIGIFFLDGVQRKVIFQSTAVLLSFIASFEKINPVEAKVKKFVCYLAGKRKGKKKFRKLNFRANANKAGYLGRQYYLL